MGGMGKTTLAKNIFQNQIIKEYFDFRAWTTITQQHNALKILAQLLSQSGTSHGSKDELGDQLHKNLFGRRYLIILDDIWTVEAWHQVSCYFPNNRNGSRIVLTTRLSNVANDCGSSPFMMRFLDVANSWKLFCEKAFKNEYRPPKQREVGEELCEKSFKNECCPSELREVGMRIVKLCKGLALSIVVMGGLLSRSPRTVEYWHGVLKDIKSITGESLDVLSLSYKHLPVHLKPCFLYMGVFEEDSEILVSEVVKLWVGEGFIKPNRLGVFSEEIGEGYMKELIERNLILAEKRSKYGKIKVCGIHDLLRDLCIKIGKQQQFFSVTRYGETRNPTTCRLTAQKENFTEDRIPLARCILALFLSRQPVKQVLLRFLKTPYIDDSLTEETLYENVNLRYAACQGNLPTSVSLVWNLQTLIIRYCTREVVAPRDIWKMRQLRHVECDHIYLPPCNGQEDRLENLQTLKKVVNLSLCAEVCKIIPNIVKLFLRYINLFHGYDDSFIEYLCNLERMHKLESLKLNIQSGEWVAKLNKKLAFPISLKELSLQGCGFHWDVLRMIGSLPQLEVLTLARRAVTEGYRWSPIDGQFLRLKFLKIDDTADTLQYWDADNSHFPVLEELFLDCTKSLREIPLEIGDIPTLELIHVKRCSISAAVSAVKIKEDQLDNGN